MRIRFALPGDSRELLGIYGQYIDTPITFEYALPSEQAFSERIAGISAYYPYIVCEKDNRIVGYAYAYRHMEREAYQWNAQLSVYVDRSFTSRGLGRKLYQVLMDILTLQGIKTVYGGVTVPNILSKALHRALGFHVIGTCRNAGYKNGRWHDVMWFEKPLAPYDSPPQPVRAVNQIPGAALQQLISAAI